MSQENINKLTQELEDYTFEVKKNWNKSDGSTLFRFITDWISRLNRELK